MGSCNWLSSPFQSYEASLRLRDARLVEDCVSFVEKMLPLDSDTGDVKTELIELGMQLARIPSVGGSARACLLSQGDHEFTVQRVRDEAEHWIFLTSNKAGNVIENQILAPFHSAAEDRPRLEVSVHYQDERTNSALTPEALEELGRRYPRIGIGTVDHAHAKLLCWDTDHAVMTSINWLSKDASARNYVGECGIYVQSPGIADILRASYDRATDNREKR